MFATLSMQLFNVTGIMLSYFVNYGISRHITSSTDSTKWRVPFALQILPGTLLLLILFENESPRWLVEKFRIDEARKALSRVRARPVDDPAIREELQEIITDFEGKEKLSLTQQLRLAFSSKQMLYQSSLAVILMFWQQWTGTNSINYYSPQIFKSVGLASSSAGLFATGIYGVVKVVFTALGLMFGVEQAGRKVSHESPVAKNIAPSMMKSSTDPTSFPVVPHLRRCRPSFCHVLYWHQPSSAP
jgi:MFS family permease